MSSACFYVFVNDSAVWGQRLLKDLMKQNGTTPPFQVAVHCPLSIGYHGKDCSDSWSYLVYLGMLNATFYCILVLSCLILCQIRCCFIKLSGSKSVELFGPLCWPPRKKARCWSSCSHGPDRLFNCDAMKIFHCPTKIAVCSQTQNSISDYYSCFPRGMVNESLSSAGPKSSKSDSETHRCFQPKLCTMSSTSFWHTKRTDMFSLFCMGIMCEWLWNHTATEGRVSTVSTLLCLSLLLLLGSLGPRPLLIFFHTVTCLDTKLAQQAQERAWTCY